MVTLVLVLLILGFSFIFKERFVKWKDLVLQRMEEIKNKNKQLSKTTLAKEIAVSHSYRGDPAIFTSEYHLLIISIMLFWEHKYSLILEMYIHSNFPFPQLLWLMK